MKKLTCLILSLVAAVSLAACGKQLSPEGMSAEQTVKYYFERFNEKDLDAMKSVTLNGMKADENGIDELISVVITNMEEGSADDFDNSWYPDATEKTKFTVKFDIQYKNGGGGGFVNGDHTWDYYLCKSDKQNQWIIVMWKIHYDETPSSSSSYEVSSELASYTESDISDAD